MSDEQAAQGYAHPTSIGEFENVYRQEYEQELASYDRWIEWCKRNEDFFGVNFYEGMRAALIFNDIKIRQLLRVLKQEKPNAERRKESA